MAKQKHYMTICAVGASLGFLVGALTGLVPLVAASAVVTAWLLARWALHRNPPGARVGGGPVAPRPATAPRPTRNPEGNCAAASPPPAEDTGVLIERLIQQGRFALLLRPQIIDNLDPPQREAVVERLSQAMSMVSEGEVLLTPPLEELAADEVRHGTVVQVDDMLLDRYPVTNRDYANFMECGGLQEAGLWDPKIWPGVRYFTDKTGRPGPRFWASGAYPRELADHPVIGVSWYEAAAYARWVGKRLPSDPEWVKAGAWPVPVPEGAPIQRKYPWGDMIEANQANLWGWGPQRTVPVTDFVAGASVGDIYQLIGNVWEWTTGNYGAWHAAGRTIESAHPLKSIRGGAFDTYFDGHASCQFQSGDAPVARKHNIGFRCALSVCDLADSVPVDALRDQAAALC